MGDTAAGDLESQIEELEEKVGMKGFVHVALSSLSNWFVAGLIVVVGFFLSCFWGCWGCGFLGGGCGWNWVWV